MYASITEIKEANRASGQYWFEQSAMRFFRSKIESKVIRGRYFITSEQFVASNGQADPRRYTVRRADDDGSITTIGPFNQYTMAEARAALEQAYREAVTA